mmetsp:Transcript_3725/g.5233  ORF Transcript_3725/g.5233 Transcript_3725/m.5233 type:complete len:124 (-) Transcript_3725:289-660(-)
MWENLGMRHIICNVGATTTVGGTDDDVGAAAHVDASSRWRRRPRRRWRFFWCRRRRSRLFPGSADFPILPLPLPSSTVPPDSMAPPDSRKWTKGGCVYVSAACVNSDDARLRVSTGLSNWSDT